MIKFYAFWHLNMTNKSTLIGRLLCDIMRFVCNSIAAYFFGPRGMLCIISVEIDMQIVRSLNDRPATNARFSPVQHRIYSSQRILSSDFFIICMYVTLVFRLMCHAVLRARLLKTDQMKQLARQ